jgi:hypothetical protein
MEAFTKFIVDNGGGVTMFSISFLSEMLDMYIDSVWLKEGWTDIVNQSNKPLKYDEITKWLKNDPKWGPDTRAGAKTTPSSSSQENRHSSLKRNAST